MSDLLTYLTDVGNLPAGEYPLRIGERVHLRPIAGTADTEAWSKCGRRLGRLPPAERQLLTSLGHHHPQAARIAAMVPRPGLGQSDRILLRVEVA